MRRRRAVARLGVTARTVTREERSFDGCHRHHRAGARRHREDHVRPAGPLPRGRRARVLVAPRRSTRSRAPSSSRDRSWSRSRRPVSATPTSTPPTATGRSSRRRRSCPATRASGSSVELGPGRDRGGARRPRRDAVARLRVRHLRLLRLRLGDALPRAEEHGLLDRRRLRRVRRRLRPLRRPGAGRHRPVRRGPAHLRRRHDVQGGQGRGHPLVRPRRRVRRRRARPPGDPVRARSRADGSSPST